MGKRRDKFLEQDVQYRALTDAEMDECRSEAGERPVYGAFIASQIDEDVARLVEATKDKPGRFRLDEQAARQKAFMLLAQHEPDDAQAANEFYEWQNRLADAVLERGLLHPQLSDLPDGIDRDEFAGDVLAAIMEATNGEQGKAQAQPSDPTSPPAENGPTGEAAKAVAGK